MVRRLGLLVVTCQLGLLLSCQLQSWKKVRNYHHGPKLCRNLRRLVAKIPEQRCVDWGRFLKLRSNVLKKDEL